MSGTPQQPSRDGSRDVLDDSRRPQRAVPVVPIVVAPSSGAASAANAVVPDTPSQRFLELALQKLTQAERDILLSHQVDNTRDITRAVEQAYSAALSKKQVSESKRWRWTFRGREIVLRDEAEKVLRGIDRLRSVGDVISNVEPLHIGLPWAAIRVMLEMAVAERDQMAALLTGMALTLSIANRLKAYLIYYQRLPVVPTTENFKKTLIDLYVRVLKFSATAIQRYQRSVRNRLLLAIWETPVIAEFRTTCEHLVASAEDEASICERELSAQDRERAQEWKAELELSLQKLDEISNIQSTLEDLHVKVDLSKLQTASGATFNSHEDEHEARCLDGTRTDLLNQIAMWADDPNGKSIFWLCGMAGTGKSTIARTVAKSLKTQRRLAASFFFQRGEGDRGNASRFFPTVALQFTDVIPGMDRFIAEALNGQFLLPGLDLEEQYEKLLSEPLQNVTQAGQSKTWFIVIDALDECDRKHDIRSQNVRTQDNGKNDVHTLLELLARLFKNNAAGFALRILVTSRPKTPIQIGFKGLDEELHKDIILEEVQASTIDDDLRIYLNHRFQQIRQTLTRLPADWPGIDQIETLVRISSPLFIFAVTVCLFVSRRDPQGRLQSLLRPQKSKALSGLNEMYLTILEGMLVDLKVSERDLDISEHNQAMDDFRLIVGSIAVLADPLSSDSLATLLSIPPTVIEYALQPLNSVLHVPSSPKASIRLLHLSFRDFLTDPLLKSSNKFHVDEIKTHARLAQQCLQRLDQPGVLTNDVCNVSKPGARRADFSADYVAACLAPDVIYACTYWAFHQLESQQELHDDDHVHQFLQRHLLHWMEALSWLGRLSSAIDFIIRLRARAEGARVLEFLKDAHRFLMRNRHLIDLAPIQVYHSALIFAPVESIIRRSFEHSVSQLLEVIPTLPSNWNALLQTFAGHEESVNDVAFAPSGRSVASASSDGSVRLWDPETGEQISRLDTGDKIRSMAFSADSQTLTVLRGSKDLQIWDTRTFERVRQETHKVAFSPGGQYLAIAVNNPTVKLYYAKSMKRLHDLEGGLYIISAMTFALNGQMLAAGSTDGMICLWGTKSGRRMHKICVHTDRIVHMIASPQDGQILASASDDRTVRLWNTSTGEQVHVLACDTGNVGALAFSHDSQVLAVALDDMTIQLWNAVTSSQIVVIAGRKSASGHPLPVMAFSPVRQCLAVAIYGEDIEVRYAQTGKRAQLLQGHSREVIALAFSSDGRILASSSDDETIRLWDASTGKERRKIEFKAEILALSSDGEILVAASGVSVHLWNFVNGVMASEEFEQKWDSNSIIALNFLTSNCYAVVGSTTRLSIGLRDVNTGKPVLNGSYSRTSKFQMRSLNVDIKRLSPDAGSAVTTSREGTVKFWSPDTGEMMQELESGYSSIKHIAFSRDGAFVALMSHERSMQVWHVKTMSHVQTFRKEKDDKFEEIRNTSAVALSADGQLVAWTPCTTAMRLKSVETGQTILEFISQEGAIRAITFSPDSKCVAVAYGLIVDLWDISAIQQMQRFEGHSGFVSAITFSPDGQIIASASEDGTIRLWNARYISNVHGLKRQDRHVGAVKIVKFAPDGQIAASASYNGTILVWDVSTGKVRRKLSGDEDRVRALAFSHDGMTLASASLHGNPRLWEVSTGNLMRLLVNDKVCAISMAFAPDGRTIALLSRFTGPPVWLWNAETGQHIRVPRAESCNSRTAAISTNLRFAATLSFRSRKSRGPSSIISIWDIQADKLIVRFDTCDESTAGGTKLGFFQDSRILVSITRSCVCLYNARTGQRMQTLVWPPSAVGYFEKEPDGPFRARFSRDGKHVQTPGGRYSLEWDSITEPRLTLKRTTQLELLDHWIRYQDRNVLYLPDDYMGECSDVHGDTLAVGQASGAVSFFRVIASSRS